MKRFLLLTATTALVGYLLTGVTFVRPGERAVVRRFGRVIDTPGPGLYVGLPWGLDRVDRVAVNQVRRVRVGYQPDVIDSNPTPRGQLLTGDHNLVNIQVAIDYDVREDEVVDFVVQAERVESLIARAAESALAEWVSGQSVDDVLITGNARLPPWLVARTQERLEPYRLGVEVRAASVAHLLPPDEVKDAFDAVTRAQTAIRTLEHKALEEAARSRRAAQAEKYRLEQLAAAYAHERVQLARAEAETFEKRLSQYEQLREQNPDFLLALWWQEIGRILARMKETGRLDLLDRHLGSQGLDITHMPTLPNRK
ncbi:MAG: protease modulator HflK [Gemmataceae bacterium]|nr:protease modulator HflK [Gemmataceae bacterium]MDW8266590.1 protease modulator HflK [Gemmataceae bacterium]